MYGIINVLIPPGMSSFQVVRVLRGLLKIKHIGHAGTLDPGAAGVLLVGVGKACRLLHFISEFDKVYVAELTLGISTTTQDADGETTAVDETVSVTPNQLGTAFSRFLGRIEQIPPMASAVKVNGKPLYKLQRQGISVEPKPRKVFIKELHINKVWTYGDSLTFGSRVLFYVRCSKGTYIRTLCHDVGRALGTHAHMSFLVRTEIGPFSCASSHTLEEIEAMAEKDDFSFILPMEAALPDYPRVRVAPLAEKRILNGNAVTPDYLVDVPKTLTVGDRVLLMSIDGNLLAVGVIQYKGQLICHPIRVLREGN